jgi:hypothetical protein
MKPTTMTQVTVDGVMQGNGGVGRIRPPKNRLVMWISARGTYREPAASSAAGDGLKVRDELVELARLQAGVRHCGEVVGERLDPLLGLPAGVSEPAGGVDEVAWPAGGSST